MSRFEVQYSVTDVQGCQERGDVELPSHTLLRYKEIAGAQVHIPTGH